MKTNIVVIGGGTGTFTVLSGLKQYEDLALKALVAVTDSGGSSGRLRDVYGILPVGDIRQCLIALADSPPEDNILRELFLYRFDRGTMAGHNFGNLFLTAMTDILGNEDLAIYQASRVLNIKGEVIPIAHGDIDLVAEYADGSVQVGEANIDKPNKKHDNTQRITNLRIQPKTKISQKALDAITKADVIITGPGDLYSSIIANFVIDGTKDAMQNSKAKFIYIINIMSKFGQTHNMSAQEHIEEIIKYSGKTPDYVLIHNRKLPPTALPHYSKQHAIPVINDLGKNTEYKIVQTDLLSSVMVEQKQQDVVQRSLIRHDIQKLAKSLYKIIKDSQKV